MNMGKLLRGIVKNAKKRIKEEQRQAKLDAIRRAEEYVEHIDINKHLSEITERLHDQAMCGSRCYEYELAQFDWRYRRHVANELARHLRGFGLRAYYKRVLDKLSLGYDEILYIKW